MEAGTRRIDDLFSAKAEEFSLFSPAGRQLRRYRCPVPFHELRTRFLGNIATPAVGVSPLKMVERLWGGKLPEFNSVDAANELIGGQSERL